MNTQYSHIDPKKGKIIVSRLSPVVIMKKISLRRADDIELPELQDCDESQVLNEPLEIQSHDGTTKNRLELITHCENAFVSSLNPEDLNNHIQKCLEMSSENKITLKNAFALQLIDCMKFLLQKKDFSTMACTLDAGTKIYSYRVDSLYQQVRKLADEVVMNVQEKQSNKSNGDGDTQGREAKEKRKANKRLTIASSGSLSRNPVGKDPRDKFVKLEGRAGALLSNARTEPTNLSLTIENSVPFWPNWETYRPLKAQGVVVLPQIKIFRDKPNQIESFYQPTLSNLVLYSETAEECVMDVDSDGDRSQGLSNSGSNIEEGTMMNTGSVLDQNENNIGVSNEQEQEVNVISTVLKRMNTEADQFGVSEPPSRIKAMQLLFADINDDYNYLNTKSVNYWAGPDFWKRPHKVHLDNKCKKQNQARKKSPKEIVYQFDGLEEKWNKLFKKAKNLGEKALCNWKKHKTTLPSDLKAHASCFIDLFHMTLAHEKICSENKPNTNNETTIIHDLSRFHNRSEKMMEDLDTSDSQDTLNDCFYDNAPENSASSENRDQLNSGFYDAGLVPEAGRLGNVIKVEIDIEKKTDDTFLVPAPKVVSYEPIRYSARPIRVDMQNLKKTMIDIIHEEIEKDVESKTQVIPEEMENTRPKAKFSNIVKTLPKKLDTVSAQDVSPAMAFLALLTLANENNLQLENNDQMNDVIVKFEAK